MVVSVGWFQTFTWEMVGSPFTKHPLKTGCSGFQVHISFYSKVFLTRKQHIQLCYSKAIVFEETNNISLDKNSGKKRDNTNYIDPLPTDDSEKVAANHQADIWPKSRSTPPKTKMEPENQWLKDAFPIEIVPF